MEGEGVAEGCLLHPQLVRVTWAEGALEAAWNVNQAHSSIRVGEAADTKVVTGSDCVVLWLYSSICYNRLISSPVLSYFADIFAAHYLNKALGSVSLA